MFGIGGFELFIILLFGFLIFGPEKLPDMARTLGRAIARFREVQRDMNEAMGDGKLVDLDNPEAPIKNPVEVLDKVIAKQTGKGSATGTTGASATGAAAAGAGAAGAGASASGAAKPEAKKASSSQASGGAKAAKSSTTAAAQATAASDAVAFPKAETFTERRARYERERAALKAKEEEGGEQ